MKKGILVENFKIKFENYFQQSIKHYEELTQIYIKEIVTEILESQLKKQLYSQIETLFSSQAQLLESSINKKLLVEFNTIQNKYSKLKTNKEFVPSKYQQYSRDLKAQKSLLERDWDKVFKESVPDFLVKKTEEQFENVIKDINDEFNKSINTLTTLMREHFILFMESSLRPKVNPHLDACKKDMWKNIRSAVHTHINLNLNKLKEAYKDCSNLSTEKIEERIDSVKKNILEYVKKLVLNKKVELQMILDTQFNMLFRFDDKGLPKKWNPEDNIDDKFYEAKDLTEEILNMYCYFRINDNDDQFQFIEMFINDDLDKPSESIEFVNGIDEQKVILNHIERRELLKHLNETFYKNYEIAKREKESSEVKYQIPLYLVVLVVVFGFDEFIIVLKNPLLFKI